MPTYVTLYKFTDRGIKNIKDIPNRIEEAAKNYEKMGGKFVGVYPVLGEYDIVAIGEAPNDETVMTFALALGSQGNVKTTTLKAFTTEDFKQIVKKLP